MSIFSVQLDSDHSIQIFEEIALIEKHKWDTIIPNPVFYQSYDFLEIIERTQKHIAFRYVLVMKQQQIVTALYVQLLHFSFKKLMNYNSEKSSKIKERVKQLIAKKNTRLMNLGNIFFTGDKGVICNNEDEIIPSIPQIFNCIYQSFQSEKPSAFLISNIYTKDTHKCINFSKNGFHSFITEPDIFLQINQEWHSFDAYLDAMSSKYRVRAKKVLSVSSHIQTLELTLEDIRNKRNEISNLYDNVLNHVTFNMATLSIEFFEAMKLLYQEQCVMKGYFFEGRLVGFAFLFTVEKHTLHVHYVGLDYIINQEHKLYNRMLLDFVAFAIEHKKTTIHFGRTATEIKTTIGATPQPLMAYLKMNNKLLNTALPYFLKRIKPAEYIARKPFK